MTAPDQRGDPGWYVDAVSLRLGVVSHKFKQKAVM